MILKEAVPKLVPLTPKQYQIRDTWVNPKQYQFSLQK